MVPLLDPSGRTYNQIALQVDAGGLPDLGQFTVTIDNVQVVTKNAMIPFEGTSAGEVAPGEDGYIVTEHGNAEHVGAYELTCTIPWDFSPCSVELTAANGDKLIGTLVVGFPDVAMQIENGTGRFKGAMGSYRAALAWDPTLTTYTGTIRGSITTVGSNKK
jgi:hypothetical protein